MELTEIHHEWGKRVKRARQARDLTATALAAQVGISRTQIHRIEGGIQAPSDGLRIRIAQVFEVNPNELFSLDLEQAS